ncbi:MAG: glycosyltransferase family 2 protein [Desulfovibrionaceae bacterium]|jgi:glycosyltransferase involved in cell wall biosynthesis|nr:glycosyltransferase family 2 protein [Desulfovibrionaceae bacterium]
MNQETTPSDPKAISVIVPVYNEQDAVEPTMRELRAAMDSLGLPYEIIAVNDGSTDDSGRILAACEGVRLIDRSRNRGYGYSLKEGIENARHDWILITDADGTYPIREIPNLVARMDDNDMIVAERSGDNVQIGLLNRLAKVILKSVIYFLIQRWIKDINSGLRLFRKEIPYRNWNIIPDGFSFTTTITLVGCIEHYKLHYHPIDYFVRAGSSKIRPVSDFMNFLMLILRIIVYFKPLKFFLTFSGAFFVCFVLRALRDIAVVDSIGTLALLFFLMSALCFFFGLIADLLVNLIHNASRRP